MPETRAKKSRPTIKLQGSPLAKFTGSDSEPSPEDAGGAPELGEQPQAAHAPAGTPGAPQNGAQGTEEGSAAGVDDAGNAPEKPKAAKRATRTATAPAANSMELAPPTMNEQNARLALDVPRSLADAFMTMSERLRNRDGHRTSQKQLPNREVMSALLWDALGDPESDEAVKRMEGRLLRYQAKKLERAAAEAADAAR